MIAVRPLLAAVAICSLIPAVAPAAPGPGEVGSQAAEFALDDLAGQTHRLSQHRGKVVMLAIVGYG